MIRYAVIENEEYARENLISYISEIRPGYSEVFRGDTVESAVEWLRSEPDVDLIFMDIELNDGNCFEIFENVKVLTPVIFTTAYDSYLMRAFDANSIAYLLKPITPAALEHALVKFENLRIPVANDDVCDIGVMRRQNIAGRILLTRGDEYFYLNVSDVAMFLSEDKCVFAITTEGKRHLIGVTSLKSLAEKLDEDKFYQISRGCVVNICAIAYVRKHFGNKLKVGISVGPKEHVETVSSGRRREFLSWFGVNLDS